MPTVGRSAITRPNSANTSYFPNIFPKIRRWLGEMEQLPFHDEAHRYNTTLGDIRTKPNTIERFVEANAAAVEALAAIA